MWWWLACSAGSDRTDPRATPALDAAAVEVLAEIDLAVEQLRQRDPEAGAGVTAAYRRFEDELEPGLRARVPPEDVLAIEYGFARLAASRGPDEAAAAGEALAERIRHAVAGPGGR